MEKKLTLDIKSFSYKQGLPVDESNNGGGFVFDCRGILNPGRIEEYKTKTGRDEAVALYLENNTQMPDFLTHVFHLIDLSVTDYLKRGFTHLEICFGCTGGQHRSVYAADQTANYIAEKYPETRVNTTHIVQEAKNWINETY